MAIQFSCPYCTASVKVPDSASGKLGACPKCGTKIRIPTMPIPPVAAPQAPLAPPVMAPFVMPAPPSAPPPSVSTDPFDFSNVAATAESAALVSTPAYSPASRKKPTPRQPMNPWVLIAIGVGVLVLAGVGVWQYIANLPVYTGNVAGERVPSERPISVTLLWSDIGVPPETPPKVVAYFQRNQTSLDSTLYKIHLTASPQGLIIRFATTAESCLASADPQLVPDVKALLDQNRASWDEARKLELNVSAKLLCENIVKAQLTGTRTEMTSFHDTVFLNALVRGLGRHCVAAAKGTNYPCVFEDEAGKLYFVVHKTVTEMTVLEKTSTKRMPLLPPDFRIWASLPAPSAPAPRAEPVDPEAPTDPEKPAREPDEEKLPEDKAMTPEAGEKMMKPK